MYASEGGFGFCDICDRTHTLHDSHMTWLICSMTQMWHGSYILTWRINSTCLVYVTRLIYMWHVWMHLFLQIYKCIYIYVTRLHIYKCIYTHVTRLVCMRHAPYMWHGSYTCRNLYVWHDPYILAWLIYATCLILVTCRCCWWPTASFQWRQCGSRRACATGLPGNGLQESQSIRM